MKFTIKNLLLLTGPFIFVGLLIASVYFESVVPIAILLLLYAVFAGKVLLKDFGDK